MKSESFKTIAAFLLLITLCIACTPEDRTRLEQQQMGVVFELNLQENQLSPAMDDSATIPFTMDTACREYYRGVIEICLFNDTNKIREYVTRVYPVSPSKWITDTLRMINPGMQAHTLQKVMIFNQDDFTHPIYASVTAGCKKETRNYEPQELPDFIELSPELSLNNITQIPVNLFNAWLEEPACFGYTCWKQPSESDRLLSFLICNSINAQAGDNIAPRIMGKLMLNKLVERNGVMQPVPIEEQIFVQDVKTTIMLPDIIRGEDFFELRLFIPDEINPEIMITDTLSGTQLREVQSSGFWLPEQEDQQLGAVLFDLGILPHDQSGTLASTDTIPHRHCWSPSFWRR